MSSVLEKISASGSRKATSLHAPSVPQVNLLPSSVGDAKRDARLRKILALGLLGVIVVAGLFYFFAVTTESQAQDELDTAYAETSKLQNEKAKLAYVPLVLEQLVDATLAQTVAMGAEVRWTDYLSAITAVLPAETSITKLEVAPLGPDAANQEATVTPAVSTVTFEIRSSTVPNTAAWLTALATIPGFQNPYFSAAAITEAEGGTMYTVTSSVEVNDSAFSNRFAPVDPDAAEGEGNS